MENNFLIYLKKRGTFWRIDGKDYSLFIAHVCRYFEICGQLPDSMSKDLLYVEVSDNDLKMVYPIFGTHFPDKETMWLIDVFPNRFVLSYTDSFIQYMYVQTEGLCRYYKVKMNVKQVAQSF